MSEVRLFLIVTLSAVVLTPLACSTDNNGPTPVGLHGEGRQTGDIWGYVSDLEGSGPIEGAYVVWYCASHQAFAGDDYTDSNGRYDIYAYPWYTSHIGCNFIGFASAYGYQTGTQRITNFGNEPNVPPVRRDFNLVPE